MKIVVNGAAVAGTSLGGKRYFHGIRDRLQWPDGVEIRTLPGSGAIARAREFAYRGRPDEIFWTPNQRGPLFARHHVVTVLDCINVEYVYRDDWRLPAYRAMFTQVLANAAAVVAISHATRDSILRNFRIDGSKVQVIAGPNDFRADFVQAQATDAAPADAPFVLLFSNTLRHKNTGPAALAYARSSAARRGIALRVVGPMAPEALADCRAAGVSLEQHFGVDDAMLRRWLEQCLFLLSPSLDEGLNLPIGEALSLGVNVLCSDIPVHREFFDGQVRFFDPNSESAMIYALDLAFDTPGSWAGQAGAPYSRTFDDVTRDYAALFQRVSRGERLGGP